MSTGAIVMNSQLPLPDFYRPEHAAEWSYAPNVQALFEKANDWRNLHRLKPSGSDRLKIHLLLIDTQKDFCFPQGTLYVGGRSGRGAIDDSNKIAQFIYRNLDVISEVTCTMDTHFPHQIFFPSFWLGTDDQPLQAHREISSEEIRSGAVRPNPAVASWLCNGNYTWLKRQVEYYCNELERAGKYKLYLWPLHCLLGSEGHSLAGVIQEARLFHSFARGSKSSIEVKGGNALTENYSVLSPEVVLRHDGLPLAQRNTQFIKTLLDADAVIIAGQAASHCVRSSIDDLLSEINAQDPALAKKVYLLSDCMSSVAVPDPKNNGSFIFDFTPQALDALARFRASGMNIVDSTQEVRSYVGYAN